MLQSENQTTPIGQQPIAPKLLPEIQRPEPLLISMEDLGRAIGAGKTLCFQLVGTGEIESVLVGRKRMPVWESVKAYVARLRNAPKKMEAA